MSRAAWLEYWIGEILTEVEKMNRKVAGEDMYMTTIRLKKDNAVWLKIYAMQNDTTMAALIEKMVEDLRHKKEGK